VAVVARVTREVVVCDVCGSEADVAPVTVAIDGAAQNAELCGAHRQQLQEAVAAVLRASAEPEAPAEPPVPARRGRKRVASPAPAAPATRTATARTPTAPTGRRMPTATCPHCGRELGVQNLGRHIAAKHPGAA
jgi:transcription elongation factor Elf1